MVRAFASLSFRGSIKLDILTFSVNTFHFEKSEHRKAAQKWHFFNHIVQRFPAQYLVLTSAYTIPRMGNIPFTSVGYGQWLTLC